MKAKILNEKQNLLIIGGIALAVIIIVTLLFVFVFNKDKDIMTVETLEEKLEKVAADFYEKHYHAGLVSENKQESLANFKDNGIKIDLTNVKLLVELEQDVKDQLEKDKCNYDKTMFTIYPKAPYGQKDYTIKLELSCEK